MTDWHLRGPVTPPPADYVDGMTQHKVAEYHYLDADYLTEEPRAARPRLIGPQGWAAFIILGGLGALAFAAWRLS